MLRPYEYRPRINSSFIMKPYFAPFYGGNGIQILRLLGYVQIVKELETLFKNVAYTFVVDT